jgi:hypothetical protein
MTAVLIEQAAPLAWLVGLRAAMDEPFDPADLTNGQLREAARELAQLRARIDARQLAIAAELDRTGAAKHSGFTSPGAMLAADFGGNRTSGDRLLRTAKNLESASRTEAALRDGQISLEQAEIVSRTVAGLPAELDARTKSKVEQRLISNARMLSVQDLRRRVLRVADLYADNATADRDENESLRLQEARAWANAELWFGAARDGLVTGGFKIPVAQADMLKNQVDAIAAPRRRHVDGIDAPEELTPSQRLGRAFCAWIERIPVDGLPTTGGTPATLTVNLDYATLLGEAAAATLATGTRVSAGEVRRLACHAGILPRVLDGASSVLDQGRAKRLFTPAQRLALADRDGGCTYPGCDRPPAWTEAHHLDHWARDTGPTTLENGALLCAWHHHQVHAANTEARIRDGRVEFRLNGIWQTNHRWRP